MIELEHKYAEPRELAHYRSSGGSWVDSAFNPVRQTIRHQLNLEQDGLCIYCEEALDEDSGHVEHIKSKSRNPPLTFTYDNLAHSCNGPGHCGHHKKSETIPIEPRLNCNINFFASVSDGRLAPSIELNKQDAARAERTLRVLGLNQAGLAWRRKGYIDTVIALSPSDSTEFIEQSPYRWLLRRL